MTASLPSKSDRLAWPLLCAALALGAAACWVLGLQRVLLWQAASWPHRPWTLWSASLVHLSGAHLLVNLLALTVLALLGAQLRAGRASAWAVLLTWPLANLALAWWPAITGYSGMSGLLCGILAILWAHTTLRTEQKAVSYVLFALLALKLLSEHAWSTPIAFDPSWGFNVVYAAHFAGAVAGALVGLACEGAALLLRRR